MEQDFVTNSARRVDDRFVWLWEEWLERSSGLAVENKISLFQYMTINFKGGEDGVPYHSEDSFRGSHASHWRPCLIHTQLVARGRACMPRTLQARPRGAFANTQRRVFCSTMLT